MANFRLLAIFVVLAILIVFGLYFLKKSNLVINPLNQKTPTGQLPTDTYIPAATGSGAIVSKLKKGDAVPLVKESSPAAKTLNQYVADVRAAAVEGGDLTISGCTATPNAFKVKTGSNFSIKNNDNVGVTVSIAIGAVYSIGAGQKSTVQMAASPAIYRYSCTFANGGGKSDAGIVEVTK